MAQDWTRIEGMIIGHDLDPAVVAGELKERAILAQLEWFPSSPQMLGLSVAVANDHIATVPAGGSDVFPGPTPAELADDLAVLFDAEVRIGNASADHLPEGGSPLGAVWPSDDASDEAAESTSTRIVEIGRTPCRHQFTAGHHPARAGAFASDAAVHRARHVHRASFG